MNSSKLKMVDLFCGAGGSSTGTRRAAKILGYEVELTCVNHWLPAVDTHKINHPDSQHFTTRIDLIDPRDLYEEGELDLLWASPECTNHSRAKNGRPKSQQSRATAHCVTRWAEALLPKAILVENVVEFLDWGPLTCGRNPQPIKARKGETFRAWVLMLESLGYKVEWKVFNAADYGVPTSRKRLFVQAVRGRRKIVWPDPTHGPDLEADLFGTVRKPYGTARQCIDWSTSGTSIFQRSRPLVDKTIQRILIGLNQYAGAAFILPQQAGGKPVKSLDEPVSPVTTKCAEAIITPYLVRNQGPKIANIVAESRSISSKDRLRLIEASSKVLSEAIASGNARLSRRRKPLTIEDLAAEVQKCATCGRRPRIFIGEDAYDLEITHRSLEPNETAVAQGFPRDYVFKGSKTDIKKMIGNAVPCGMAQALALAVLSQDNEIHKYLEKEESSSKTTAA